MPEQKPKLSVISAVFNDSAGLEATLLSVFQQDYPGIETIVIDGGSEDGFPGVIRRYENRISRWVSEPDRGIYHAMNNGLEAVSGDWVIFLNAGDVFYGPVTVSGIFSRDHSDADIIYGDAVFDYSRFRSYRRAGRPGDLWKGMFCCHQAIFFRRTLFSEYRYRQDLRIASDYDLLCHTFSVGKKFSYVPLPVCIWKTGGRSGRQQLRSVLERYSVSRRYFSKGLIRELYYFFLLSAAAITLLSQRLLPERIFLRLVKLKESGNIHDH